MRAESAAAAPRADPGPAERWQIRVEGQVQGVGFRPHVYRQAQRFGIAGFVRNDPDGVVLEAEGRDLRAFAAALRAAAPAAARIDRLSWRPVPARGEHGFRIAESAPGPVGRAVLPPDLATCEACLAELFDPRDRRYLHPFIACTDCGPRFTMTRRLPYDRAATSMAEFPMCPDCEREYRDPESRRFHAEPVACHRCGPQLDQDVPAMAAALERGEILALKGIGGFHLVCDARDHAAVARLRARKRRDGKPFAVMVLNAASAARHAVLDPQEQALLESRERPVTLLQRRAGACDLSPEVAPGLRSIGLLLPYTALHYLLFHALLGRPAGHAWLEAPAAVALVTTSANVSGDPLVIDDAEARAGLRGIADQVLAHDREIVLRADDSVARVAGGRPLLLRRGRGHAPGVLRLGEEGPRVLALGAHLKATVTLTRDDRAFLSQHIGDLETPRALDFHAACAQRLRAFEQCEPERIACDLHPDYASTRLAERLGRELRVPLVRVQHHHAHLAAVLAEHRHPGPALGLALDGHGHGADGGAWGGELLRLHGAEFERLGHLAPLAAPGGDRAAREPWRLAAGVLHELGRGQEIPRRFPGQPLAPALRDLLAGGAVPRTSAAGRLFDAAAGLLGVCHRAGFEGEAPMRLEGLARRPRALAGGYVLRAGVLDFAPLLAALADCGDPAQGADWFHGTLVEALLAWSLEAAGATGLDTVALGGGCCVNVHLAAALPGRLRAAGLKVLEARRLPPNDGGLSLGQAWVARRWELPPVPEP